MVVPEAVVSMGPMPSESPRKLRDAFGSFMTGVTVVTTVGRDGEPLGFTANSFSSVSLEPPLLQVAVAKRSLNCGAFVSASGFAVNVLAEDQKDVSNTFAAPAEERFATVDWHKGREGMPLIQGVSAWFECSMHKVVEAGDHAILIGRIESFDSSGSPGLGYYRSTYFTPALTSENVAVGPSVVVGALILSGDSVVLTEEDDGTLTLPTTRIGGKGVRGALNRLIESLGIKAEPSFIYSVFEDNARGQQHIVFLCHTSGGALNKGQYVRLERETLGAVSDKAVSTMLLRLSEEAKIDDFRLYIGDREKGEVRRIHKANVR